jgi:hypothetical protein
MASNVTLQEIDLFFRALSKRYNQPAELYLIGGGALVLLGYSRPTLDIDYVGSDNPSLWTDLQRVIDQLAKEMNLDLEAVPYQEMIPLPSGYDHRHILIREYGALKLYIFDPYSIALGKLDRGSESDLEDIAFLVRNNFITTSQLAQVKSEALTRAQDYDLTPKRIEKNFELVLQLLRG